MINLKKLCLSTSLALGLVSTLAGTMAIPANARAETQITFYHYQTGNFKALRALFDEFEAANPDIKVKDVFAQSRQITGVLQAALAADRPVDIATVIGKNISFFLNNTNAVDMVEASKGDTAWLEAYLPNFLDLGRSGDAIYAIPTMPAPPI